MNYYMRVNIDVKSKDYGKPYGVARVKDPPGLVSQRWDKENLEWVDDIDVIGACAGLAEGWGSYIPITEQESERIILHELTYEVSVDLDYDETKHPRDPSGTATGGQWASKGGGSVEGGPEYDKLREKGIDFLAHQMSGLIGQLRKGGFSQSLDGISPTTGYMTAISKKTETKIPLENVEDKHITKFVVEHFNDLTPEDMYLGGWVSKDEKDGKTYAYLDSSRNIQDLQEAVAVAVSSHQIAIFDLNKFRDIYIDYDNNNRLWVWADPEKETGKTWLE